MAHNENIADSLLYTRKQFDGERKATEWLRVAYNAYCRLQGFRDERRTNKNYAYGKQYNDTIVVNGRKMSKKDYLREKGIPALQINIAGKLKRVVQGQFRLNGVSPVGHAPDPNEREYAEGMSQLLKQNMALNSREELDARTFEEFAISALASYKVSWDYRDGKLDVFTDYINPNLVFFPASLDFSLKDIRFCGMLHSLDFSDVLAKFSKSDEDDIRIRDIYNHCIDREYIMSQFSTDSRTFDIASTDFFYPSEYGKCRVIELWTKERRKAWFCDDPLESDPYFVPYDQEEQIKAINAQRLELNIKRNADGTPMTDDMGNVLYFQDPDLYEKQNIIQYSRKIETYWYYRYLTPDGYILEEGQSPYWNRGESFHPFVFKPYPYIDGEFHSLISEMRPSQDYFDYYMIALDFYIRNAAKGVLMIDEQALSDNMPLEQVMDQYVKTDGVILYTSKKGGRQPDTKVAGSIPGGFDYIIQMSRSLIEDVSGVQAALQGKNAGQSGVLYQTQVTQASSSVLDLIRTYNSFLRDVAKKTLKIINQFYSGIKQVNIAGHVVTIDMDTIHDVDLDVSMSEDTDTPVYRALNNQFLLQMAQSGQIPFRVALECGSFPNSAKLIAMLDAYEQQVQQQQQAAMAQQQNMPQIPIQ